MVFKKKFSDEHTYHFYIESLFPDPLPPPPPPLGIFVQLNALI